MVCLLSVGYKMLAVLEVCSCTQSDLLALSEEPLESRGNLENWVPAYICT